MTREELKVHCEKQIKECEMWAKHKGEEPHGKIYEEHTLILELLEQESFKPMIEIDLYSVIKQKYIERDVLDKIRAEIDQITDTMGVSYNQYVSKIDVLKIIDKYREG